jgi:Flp pilus assembly pilin Flp
MTTSTPDTRPDHTPLRRPVFDDDRGSATAEYAVVILAAVAFAGVLAAVMRSGEVQAILTDLVRGALSL